MSDNTEQHFVGSDSDCPACNVLQVFKHCASHASDMTAMTRSDPPTFWERGNHMGVDFGPLSIEVCMQTDRFTVEWHGKKELAMTPDKIEVMKLGPWVGWLAKIRKALDADFGPMPVGSEKHACWRLH